MSYKKYYVYKQQYSEDGGITWKDTDPLVTSPSGDPIGEYATLEECQGIVPPTPTNKKLVANYSDGKTLEVECNSSGSLTSGETQPSGYQYSAMTTAIIGDCVTKIRNNAFSGFTSLTSVTIPNSVTSIGKTVFSRCSSLTSAIIGAGVTSIGASAFYSGTSLTSITINATTPPTLGTYAFTYTNNCPIYVPAASVDAYKSASGWSTYASRIQPIP